jgi:hypothetical protein
VYLSPIDFRLLLSFLRSSSELPFLQNSISFDSCSENSILVGFQRTRRISRRMGTGFELAAYRNPWRTVLAKIKFRLADFLAAQFILVSSQPIGFQVNEPQIRIHRPRKPMVTYLRFYHRVLLSISPMLLNTAISLVNYIGRPVARGGLIFFGKK